MCALLGQEVWLFAQLPDVVAVEQSLDRCRKKRVPDLVTRVRRELQRPLRIADQLVGQRLRYGHAARNRGSNVAKMMGKGGEISWQKMWSQRSIDGPGSSVRKTF